MVAKQEMAASATAETLVTPELAQSMVSRAEIANLLVVEHCEAVGEEIARQRVERDATLGELDAAMSRLYEVWSATVRASTAARVSAWRGGLAVGLDQDVGPAEFPQLAPLSARNGCFVVDDSHRRRNQDRQLLGAMIQDFVRIGRVESRWYGSDGAAHLLTHFLLDVRVDWTSSDVTYDPFSQITIRVDITPDSDVMMLFAAASATYRAWQAAATKLGKLLDEVKEENIAALQRRARAALTRKSLGELGLAGVKL